jgi:hypothetical protein
MPIPKTTIVRLKTGDLNVTLSLAEFLEANAGLDRPERDAVFAALEAGRVYHGGGGAEAEWSLEVEGA